MELLQGNRLDFLPDLFHKKFRTDPEKQIRKRGFDRRLFFLCMVKLVSGKGEEGYLHALMKVFTIEFQKSMPTKSSFCEFRQKIHFRYFQAAFEQLNQKYSSTFRTYKGLRIFAIDGKQLILPRCQDIVDHKFNGRIVSENRESYMPRGYLTQIYDVLSGVTIDFKFNPTLNEIADAIKLLKRTPSNSLIIYDRLYFCSKLVKAHVTQENYFLMRCRRNACKEIGNFFLSDKKKTSFVMHGKRIYLYKLKSRKDNTIDVYATNLPKSYLERNLLKRFYELRWEVETSFRELAETCKTEQWHSKSYNGVMQELWCQFLLINLTKFTMNLAGQNPLTPERRRYKKANFKLVYDFITQQLSQFLTQLQRLVAHVKPLLKVSTESRLRGSRTYPREIKWPRSPYKYNNTGWTWDF